MKNILRHALLIVLIQFSLLSFGQNYEIWGVTNRGDKQFSDGGTIYKLDSNGSKFSAQHLFGKLPSHTRFNLIEASNGNFYGIESTNSGTIIYEYDYRNNEHTQLHTLGSGFFPSGQLLEANNGKLYGMTRIGGSTNQGILFEFDLLTNTYSVKIEFNGSNGSIPYGSLIEVSNNKLYGLTSEGGSSNKGILFEYDLLTNTLTKKIDFNGNSNGSNPRGSLIQASNGKLYGVTFTGGTSNNGTLFSFSLTNDSLSTLINFNSLNGANPFESPMQASNGKLYGYCSKGGIGNNDGVLYEYDILTDSLFIKKDLFALDGSQPLGILTEMPNGLLYGLTPYGGAFSRGVLFEYNIITNSYTKKIDFDPWAVQIANPLGSLVKVSANKLIGTGSIGRSVASAILFDYDLITDSISPLLDFNDYLSGEFPSSGIVQANNEMVYGTVSSGRFDVKGGIYEMNPITKEVKLLTSFNSNSLYGNPSGDLIVTNDRRIVGSVTTFGTTPYKLLYDYDIDKDTFEVVHQLNSVLYPSLMSHSNGKIYGVYRKSVNSTSYEMILFEYNMQTKSVQDLTILYPYETEVRLIEGLNGRIYGVSSEGGIHGDGELFSFNILNSTKTILHTFNNSSSFSKGSSPKTLPIIASNGKLYGQTELGGTNNLGVFYEFDLSNNTYSVKTNYNGNGNGSKPKLSGLAELDAGILYGYTYRGGFQNYGVLFEYNLSNSTMFIRDYFGRSFTGIYPIGTPIKIKDCLFKRDTITTTICAQQFVSPFGSKVWTSSGVYTDTLSIPGCDSIIHVNLTLDQGDTTVVSLGTTTLASNSFNSTYQWLDCNNNYAVIPNETNQLFTAVSSGNYAVEVTSLANGCVDTSACYPITLVGLDEQQFGENLTIYPNPTKNNVTISFGSNQSSFSSQVYNIHGKLINESNHTSVNQVELNLGESEGVYFIHLVSNNGERIIRKVVKQ